MILYHLTAPIHLERILDSGYLRTTESNIGTPETMAETHPHLGPFGQHLGPDVVWLFDTPTPTSRQGMLNEDGDPFVDKTRVRFTVEVPDDDVAWWPEWATAQGINRYWYKILARFGRPQEWFVVERPVWASEWVSIEILSPEGQWTILEPEIQTERA